MLTAARLVPVAAATTTVVFAPSSASIACAHASIRGPAFCSGTHATTNREGKIVSITKNETV